MKMTPLFKAQKPGNWIEVPASYRTTTKWIPRIGDVFPNFQAQTTQGPLTFHPFAENGWTVFFSFARAHTPVCTSELRGLAAAQDDFDALGVKLLGISRDDTERQQAWLDEIESGLGRKVAFPLVSDRSARLVRTMGMIHPRQDPALTIRKTVILDPALRVRMIFEYPILIGRSTEELLRTVEALQAQERHRVALPADWMPGEDWITDYPGRDDRARDKPQPKTRRLGTAAQRRPVMANG